MICEINLNFNPIQCKKNGAYCRYKEHRIKTAYYREGDISMQDDAELGKIIRALVTSLESLSLNEKENEYEKEENEDEKNI